ncbi:unnamed protein product [Zymoseptoria tritici ST99CH_1A5]|uniref:DUF7730 domain-containing protein n=1 Tax=Zymoseptoria tritici ST99CH_1A5 TaxID=1276529 RepID=A0A1Y6M0B1_ZYMTR|nr:unnamed protein product [Zymoseptoria tritici ST99CH_1A5]
MGRHRIHEAEKTQWLVQKAAELDEDHVSKSDLENIRTQHIVEQIVALKSIQDPTKAADAFEAAVRELGLPFRVDKMDIVPHKPFPFQKLPAEQRNQVYGLLLTKSEPIAIYTYRPKFTPRHRLAKVVTGPNFRNTTRKGLRKKNTHTLREFDMAQGRYVDNPESFASILFTSWQVYGEAASVLYGTNRFELSSEYATKCFMGTIKHGYMFLTEVDLGFPTLEGLKNSLKELLKARTLSKVYLAAGFCLVSARRGVGKDLYTAALWSDGDVFDRAEALSRILIPFLSDMQVSYKAAVKDGEVPAKALETIRFRGEVDQSRKAELDAFKTRLRQILNSGLLEDRIDPEDRVAGDGEERYVGLRELNGHEEDEDALHGRSSPQPARKKATCRPKRKMRARMFVEKEGETEEATPAPAKKRGRKSMLTSSQVTLKTEDSEDQEGNLI